MPIAPLPASVEPQATAPAPVQRTAAQPEESGQCLPGEPAEGQLLPEPLSQPRPGPLPEVLTAPQAERVVGLLPDADWVSDALEAAGTPLERARVATLVLAELEQLRLQVAQQRRAAAAATGMSSRALAAALGISVGAACDLRASAAGRSRRPSR